jgi:hypothetical protein
VGGVRVGGRPGPGHYREINSLKWDENTDYLRALDSSLCCVPLSNVMFLVSIILI